MRLVDIDKLQHNLKCMYEGSCDHKNCKNCQYYCIAGYELAEAAASDKSEDEMIAEIKNTKETADGFLMHEGTKETILAIVARYFDKESSDG